MKFIVDAQLPKLLADVLIQKGFNAIHTLDLPEQNNSPDNFIAKFADEQERVVISKDVDFLYAHILKGSPQKLIFVTTGNTKNRTLLNIFRRSIEQVVTMLMMHDCVELSEDNVLGR